MNELTDLMYEFCMRGGTIEMGQNLNTGVFECRMKTKIDGKEHGALVRHAERDRSVFSRQMRYSLEQFARLPIPPPPVQKIVYTTCPKCKGTGGYRCWDCPECNGHGQVGKTEVNVD